MVGTPAMLIGRRHPAELRQTPPLVGHHRWSGESLLYVIANLSLSLHRDADLYLLISLGLPLSQMWRSYRR
jgi:hypothetical protein